MLFNNSNQSNTDTENDMHKNSSTDSSDLSTLELWKSKLIKGYQPSKSNDNSSKQSGSNEPSG